MSRNYRNFSKLLFQLSKTIMKWNWAYYIGGQETKNRLEAQHLKNRDLLLKTEDRQNKLVLQDLEIEKRKLEILKLERELSLSAETFTASDYADPGNIRQEERKKKV